MLSKLYVPGSLLINWKTGWRRKWNEMPDYRNLYSILQHPQADCLLINSSQLLGAYQPTHAAAVGQHLTSFTVLSLPFLPDLDWPCPRGLSSILKERKKDKPRCLKWMSVVCGCPDSPKLLKETRVLLTGSLHANMVLLTQKKLRCNIFSYFRFWGKNFFFFFKLSLVNNTDTLMRNQTQAYNVYCIVPISITTAFEKEDTFFSDSVEKE